MMSRSDSPIKDGEAGPPLNGCVATGRVVARPHVTTCTRLHVHTPPRAHTLSSAATHLLYSAPRNKFRGFRHTLHSVCERERERREISVSYSVDTKSLPVL